jgi:pilus assembly protein Flp/PilA
VQCLLIILIGLLRKFNQLRSTDGQDLVEYALVVAIIAFGGVAAMKALSTEINVAFKTISSDLGSSL